MSHTTPEPSAAASPPASPAASDRAGHIETHGVDVIPDAERHGRPRELFWVWMSANVVYLYFVLGGVLVLLGLSIWEALAITVVGNLWWAIVGWLAVSGPASGTPSVTVMRAMFGIRGNRQGRAELARIGHAGADRIGVARLPAKGRLIASFDFGFQRAWSPHARPEDLQVHPRRQTLAADTYLDCAPAFGAGGENVGA